MAGRDNLWENPNPFQGLTSDGTTCLKRELCTQSRTKNGC